MTFIFKGLSICIDLWWQTDMQYKNVNQENKKQHCTYVWGCARSSQSKVFFLNVSNNFACVQALTSVYPQFVSLPGASTQSQHLSLSVSQPTED